MGHVAAPALADRLAALTPSVDSRTLNSRDLSVYICVDLG